MSVVGYLNLLHQCSKDISWESDHEWLILICKRFIPDGSEDVITDVNSLFTKLEDRSLLGIDRLDILKDLLEGIRKWDLLRMVDEFEIKRKDYKQFLEKISRALDESNELQRLISICKRQNLIAHEREEHIGNVDALFTELEQGNNLGIGNLSILRTMATDLEKPDLCRLVDDFHEKRKQGVDAERKRKEWEDYKQRAQDQAASVLVGGINIGERLMGVLTPHCTFRNVTGGAVVVTTWMVLRRSPSMEEFVNAFKEAVLPFGNCLLAICEGSIRFTLQAENTSALDALWQSYQDATLQTNLQEFLVTEDIKQLGGGEVTLTVHIDEDEYRNAKLDLMISETEEMKLDEKRGLKDRGSSDSDPPKERNITTANTKDPFPEREFLPFDRKVSVEEYLEDLQENLGEITLSSDSGVGTWSSVTSEYGIYQGDSLEKLDQVEGLIKDAVENCNSFLETCKDVNPMEGRPLDSMEEALKRIRVTFGTLKKMEKLLMNVESNLTTSTIQATIQHFEKLLRSDEVYCRNLTSKDKTSIRVLARKVRYLKRVDTFHYLRKITPPGTTGPLLPDALPISKIPKDKKYYVSVFLKYQYSGMQHLTNENLVCDVAEQHGLRRVGDLYDFLCEQGLPSVADVL